MSEQNEAKPSLADRLKANPAILDAATVLVGIVCVSAGVGCWDWRAGLVAFGALLLGAEAFSSIVRRGVDGP